MKTEIIFILDRSGSMSDVADDVRGGFETFIKDQQQLPDQAAFTLVQFDDQYQIDYEGVSIHSDIKLSYTPRGATSLLDAIGKTIVSQGERFAAMSDENRPDKVLVFIQTDGQENSSKEYNVNQIKNLIEQQTTKYNWNFVFLSSDLNAVNQARSYGINAANVAGYAANKTASMMDVVSHTSKTFRSIDANQAASLQLSQDMKDNMN